ncbi:FxSxx-COOH system tetratricopeptide repeat protein [Cryptosporangium sp. NPDC048952]|uniref:FxSxx-COOH system tetratricopeptide repeat protein n=1 Tax=Cryptosporangium sp. NPDC048952 TaxID=3363961 RepID=UPI003711BF5D
MTETSGPARDIPVVWGNVPQRNKNFTGREDLLDQLKTQLAARQQTAVLPFAIRGLGGVGKTQLAAEYAYRNSGRYQVVWWVSAEDLATARSGLSTLAPRLGLQELSTGRTTEEAVAAVLDSLRRGVPFARWLLIFDNADQPEELRELLPQGQADGHVLVTSRNHRWQSVAETVEVDVFARPESLKFLSRRVVEISTADADRLSEELGDLPLALEQAGALMVETGMPVADYLKLLQAEASKLLTENQPTDYPFSVAAAWNISMAHVSRQTPFALEMLQRCALFGPEPIPRDLLIRGARVLPGTFGESLQDPIVVGRAMRELGRYALARIDNNRRTVQVHRLIQRLVRDGLTPEQIAQIRNEVHLLLAERDPGTPSEIESWGRYQELYVHLGPSDAAESADPKVRRLIRNTALYLYATGEYRACLALIDQALESWGKTSGPDNPDVLLVQAQKADALWGLGRYREAYRLRRPTLELMRTVLGADDENTLFVTNGFGADLRVRGEFQAALDSDGDSLRRHLQVFGESSAETFNARNNLAVDNELTGRYPDARKLYEENYTEALAFYSQDDHPFVVLTLSGMSRNLRHEGRYGESLERAYLAYDRYQRLIAQKTLNKSHLWVLTQNRDLSIGERLAGQVEPALARARAAYDDFRMSEFGEDHPDALAAGINLGNALRLADSLGLPGGDLQAAVDLLNNTVERYGEVWRETHPFAHAARINLAIAQFTLNNYEVARSYLEAARDGLEATVGDGHHYTLICLSNLATALAELDRAEEARQIGEAIVPRLRASLGKDHPHTLGAVLNLGLDRIKTGAGEDGEALRQEALTRFASVLGADHYDVETARRRGRVSSVIEPPPV